MKKYLISYGDENYALRKERFWQSAQYSCFFNKVQIFSPEGMDANFYNRPYAALKSQRGGGYWIWKPYFVKKALDALDDNDILCYLDVGCTINTSASERFNDYLDMLSIAKTGTLAFSLEHKESRFTKQEVFNHFNSSENIINSEQLLAGILLFRKCTHSAMLVNQWYQTAIDHSSLFTDEIEIPQRPDFFDHRHDQSIFSVIRKTHGALIIPDETDFSDYISEGMDFPFWATRLKS